MTQESTEPVTDHVTPPAETGTAAGRDVEPVKRRAFKAVCPANPNHRARVLAVRQAGNADRRIRRCVCDSCGREWNESGDAPDETAPELPKYPEVLCPDNAKHQGARAYKRDKGKLAVVCDTCGNTWVVDDEISKPKKAIPSGATAGDRKVPRHKRANK